MKSETSNGESKCKIKNEDENIQARISEDGNPDSSGRLPLTICRGRLGYFLRIFGDFCGFLRATEKGAGQVPNFRNGVLWGNGGNSEAVCPPVWFTICRLFAAIRRYSLLFAGFLKNLFMRKSANEGWMKQMQKEECRMQKWGTDAGTRARRALGTRVVLSPPIGRF